MTIGAVEVLTYALAGVGVSCAAHSLMKLGSHGVDAHKANPMLVKLAGQGQVGRLVKLTNALPGSYMEAVKVAAVAGNNAKSRDRIVLEAAINPAFDARGKAFAQWWKRFVDLGFLGVMLVGAAIGLALSEQPRHVPLGMIAAVGGATVLVAIYLVTRRTTATRALADARATVVPALVQAFVDGATSDGPPSPPVSKPASASSATVDPNDWKTHTFRIARGDVFDRTVTLSASIIKVGKVPSAALHLDDPAVSRMHAIIEIDEDGASVIDLGSQTGTFVNGSKVNKSKLVPGDTLGIGPFRISLHRGTEAGSDPFRTPGVMATGGEPAKVAHAPSLRDGVCPICKHETIRTIKRTDTRFDVLVCAACGYTQEFADVARLDRP